MQYRWHGPIAAKHSMERACNSCNATDAALRVDTTSDTAKVIRIATDKRSNRPVCSITDRLTAMSKAPKPWLATWNMPNGDARQFRALSEGAGNSWLKRNIDNHGGTGNVERVA